MICEDEVIRLDNLRVAYRQVINDMGQQPASLARVLMVNALKARCKVIDRRATALEKKLRRRK